MSNIAIIPARGGSKRIPRKNIREFHGKAIIAYSIEAALKTTLFDEVMVSTDDEEIAEIAKKYGATVPFIRSQSNADDFATLSDVIIEVLEAYKHQGKTFDLFCCILPTAPLLLPQTIRNGFELLQSGYDSVCPVVQFGYPIQRALHIHEGKLQMINSEYMFTRSQDLSAAYHDCGQFYWGKTTVFFEAKTIFTQNTGALIVPETQVQDIDNLDDWALAEIKYAYMQSYTKKR